MKKVKPVVNKEKLQEVFHGWFWGGFTLPETNSSHLKMDGWKTSFLLGWPIFRGELLVLGSVTDRTNLKKRPICCSGSG